MPTVKLPDGTPVNFPDGTSNDTMNSALSDYWAKKGGGVAGANGPLPGIAPPAANLKPAGGLADKLKSVADETFARSTDPDEHLRMVGNIGRGTVRQLASIPHDLENPKGAAIIPGTESPDIIDQVKGDYKQGGLSQAIEGLGSDALTAGLLHTSREPVADTLNTAGQVTKKVGSLASRVGIGAPSAADNLGADAGRAVSSNRVVAATPSSLKAKVGALVEPASQARDAILAKSNAAPTDITSAVSDPFNTLTRKATNPKTGAATPSSVRKLSLARRAITQIQDPETGEPTQTPKDPNLTPLEQSQLQRNIYGMTDYTSPDNDLANQGTKGAAANLRDTILAAAPEAGPMTQSLHDIMGANDITKNMTNGAIPTSKSGVIDSVIRGAKMGIGTGTGALLDKLGSGMMDAGGAVRPSPSPVAPVRPGPTPPQSLLPGQTLAQTTPQPGPTVTPPPAPVAGRLPATAGQGSPVAPLPGAAPYPELNEDTASNRTAPRQPVGEVIPPRRRLVVTPDGVRAEGLPLESTTGRGAPSTRPSLISRLKSTIGAAAVHDQAQQVVSGDAGVTPPKPIPALAKMPTPKPGINTNKAAAPAPARLPAPTDIDGWEALVDKGQAKYNTASHQYDYTGPIKSKLKSK